ncbi:MAG: hypothetical protein KA184_05350 [Candidatus Hydrogenedentes bacterium]|nr:hypothetical protein [Candidatus Hydrogenedentota bacterium]
MSDHVRAVRMRDKRARHATLYGWVRWAPLFIAPFASAFYEVWLNTQIWRSDYQILEATTEIGRVKERLRDLYVEQARWLAIEKLQNRAPDLGLVEPQPDQVATILVDPLEEALYEKPPKLEIASSSSSAPDAPAAPALPARSSGPGRAAAGPVAPWMLDESPESQLGSF